MSRVVKEEKTMEIENVITKSSKLKAFPQIFSYLDKESNGYDIEIHLPGANRDTINLKMDKDSIYVAGETDIVRYVGTYRLCCSAEPEKATSTYKEGLLKIHLPFKKSELIAVEIEVD